MTPREVFLMAYVRVCAAHGVVPDDDQVDECFRQVERYSEALYDDAATTLNASCVYLPKPAEWRQACAALLETQRAAAPEEDCPAEDEGPYCPNCEDTGFATRTCFGSTCWKKYPHGEHRYVVPCSCRGRNPVIRRNRRRAVPAITKDEAARLESEIRQAAREVSE
jgi:hypothetical protein